MPNITSAPGKIILFGEHAVVYGIPAIAVPLLDLRVTVNWTPTDNNTLTVIGKDHNHKQVSIDFDMDDLQHPLTSVIRQVLHHYNAPTPSASIEIQSDIPIASGLGSGAAVSTALGRAIANISNYDIPADVLNHIVFETEKIHHGTPSGIDNTVIVYEQAIKFIKNYPIEPLTIHTPFSLIVADTGIPAPTHESVGDVRALYDADQHHIQTIFDEIGAIVDSAIDCIAQGDIPQLGSLMTQNHEYLQKLTVSSKELDKLVHVALDHGALGAKLSGGGRGGNMIVLVQNDMIEPISQHLIEAGAARVFSTLVK
jgi:mevalonate kinase